MHLIPVDESLCESALRITQAISRAFKWCWIYGLHQEVPHERNIMYDVRQCYMLDNLTANYKLTSLESPKRSNLRRADLVLTIVNLILTSYIMLVNATCM